MQSSKSLQPGNIAPLDNDPLAAIASNEKLVFCKGFKRTIKPASAIERSVYLLINERFKNIILS
jgi:hypothetical protein